MSVDNRKCLVRMGKHASAADWTTAPVGYLQANGGAHLLPESHSFAVPEPVKNRRGPDHPLNAGLPSFRGAMDISKEYELGVILRGLSGNNGGAIDPALTTDVTALLDCLFGTDSIDPAGAATTAINVGSNGATKTLAVTETARFPVGTVIRFQAPLGTFHVRQVRARSAGAGAGNVTVDRTWTGAVADLTTIERLSRWKDDPSVVEHVHLGFDVEWTGAVRAVFLGGMGKWTIDLASGRHAMLKAALKFTDIQVAAPASTAFVAPVAGGGLVRVNNKLWIGDEAFHAHAITIAEGGECSPRPSDEGPNGIMGFTKHKGGETARTKMNAKFIRGALAGEVPDSAGATFTARVGQGHTLGLGDAYGTFDVAVQNGTALAALGYGVMRQAHITRMEETVIENKRGFDVDFEATGFDADLAPFEWHMG